MMRLLMVLFAIWICVIVIAAEGELIPLPNPGFEELNESGWAMDWGQYNWGPETSDGDFDIDSVIYRSGSHALRGINIDDDARAGGYCHVPLQPGTYTLSFWARAESGKTAQVRCYLANMYSRHFLVTDKWTFVSFRYTLQLATERAEINIQNSTGERGVVWFDDVELHRMEPIKYEAIADTRPVNQQPRMVYFDAHLMNWADNAEAWVKRGFSGAFLSYIFGDIHDDPWATDGDPTTRGEDDKLLQECRQANDRCKAAGMDRNILKVAFYVDLPDPFDEAGYSKLIKNFREAARFARLAGINALAIDTEYTAYQFQPSWEGWKDNSRTPLEMSAKWRERWAAITRGMAQEYPDMDLLILPEGSIHYGRYWNDMFSGMLEGLMQAGFNKGVSLLTESTYTSVDPGGLAEYTIDVRETTARLLPPEVREYWLNNCDIAIGCWPLGYYRAITGPDGKFAGWSGREEVFGDRIVGSYADKSENYTLGEFRNQLAAARTHSGRYCWIYGHGASWWQMSQADADHYKKVSLQQFPEANFVLPTVKNIEDYYRIAASREVIREVQK